MFAAAARGLVRQPSFAAAAIGTLAVGIAASAALFSIVNAVLLEPLPYPRAQDIYTVRTYFPSGRFTIGLMASEEMTALAGLTDIVERTALAQRSDNALTTDASARQVAAYFVSGSFFDLFKMPMAHGRAIAAGDCVRGAPEVAVLSNALWTSAFGRRDDIVGGTITFGSRRLRVVGVAPPGFDVPAGADLWIAAWIVEAIGHGYEGYVRLRPGGAPAALGARMQQIMDRLGRKYPDQELGRAYRLRPLLEATVGDLGPIVLILFGATALLLLLAAVNVSNLLLVRSTRRSREFAIRAALGAGRARIMRLLLTESLLIAACGGLAGVLAAYAAIRLLIHYGASRLPRIAAVTFDAKLFGFVLVAIMSAAALIAIVPALRMSGGDIAPLMNESGRSIRGSRRTRRLLGVFVVAQIAVAIALVAAAGRLLRSYQNLQGVDPGFDPRGRLAIDVVVPPSVVGDQDRRNVWWDAVADRLHAAGAVDVVSASSLPLRAERDTTTFIDLVSRPDIPPERRPNGRRRLVSPDFFKVMGIRLLAGRGFTAADGAAAPAVAIVNDAFVRRSLGDADPLRERIRSLRFRRQGSTFVPEDGSIVGVVADVRYSSLAEPAEPTLYLPRAQYQTERESFVVTTADGLPERHVDAFRATLASFDAQLATDFGTLSGFVATSIVRQRLGMWLMSGFGAAALLLATIGVFGVVAYVVAQRSGEIAVRQALGATRLQVVRMVVQEESRIVAMGIAAGLLIAVWTGRLVGRYVFGVRVLDPLVLGGSVAAVATVVISATLLPAARATVVGLARSLRED